MMHRSWKALLLFVSTVNVASGSVECPNDKPCYDSLLLKCNPGNLTLNNGDGLVYCNIAKDGSCSNKAICYDSSSGCVCKGDRPCLDFFETCVPWRSSCKTTNTILQWCPDSPTPTPTPTPMQTLNTNSPWSFTYTPSTTERKTSYLDSSLDNFDPYKVVDSISNTIIVIVVISAITVILIIAGLVYCSRRRNTPLPVTSQPSQPLTSQAQQYRAPNPTPVHGKLHEAMPVATNTYTVTTSNSTNQFRANDTGTSDQASLISSRNQPSLVYDMESLQMHHIPPSQVSIIKPLASGAYGEVLLAEFQGQFVAVKRLLPTKQNNKNELVKFIEEIKLHAKIDCAYIVQFVGASWTKPSDITMLTEYMDRGDLRNFLQSTSPATFTWTQKLQCALDIVQALVYLHSLDQKVIHRDLKSRNVLLNSSMQSKVTDFGVSREIDDFQTMTAGVGTFRWMAPEVLQDGHYETSADMFSYGVILSELDTHLLPYDGLRNERGNPYTDTAIIAKVMNGELKPQFSNHYPSWFSEIGNRCIQLNPDDRPTSMEVAYVLRVELQRLAV